MSVHALSAEDQKLPLFHMPNLPPIWTTWQVVGPIILFNLNLLRVNPTSSRPEGIEGTLSAVNPMGKQKPSKHRNQKTLSQDPAQVNVDVKYLFWVEF